MWIEAKAVKSPPLVPDLWRAGEKDARRLYDLLLTHLLMRGRHDWIIQVCRQVRRFASRGPGVEQGPFTLFWETDALWATQDYAAAWRLLRRHEPIFFGKRLDLRHHRWKRTSADYAWLTEYYAPLLYANHRYRLGCELLETALRHVFSRRKVRSYDLLGRIYNGEAEPDHRVLVTLAHFYGRLGKTLSQWQHWRRFVQGFHPRLFRLAHMNGEDLQADSGLLPTFCHRIGQVRSPHATSGVSQGEADLVDSPAKVRRWHETTKRQREAFEERIKPTREAMELRLRELFPILRDERAPRV